MPLSFRSLMFMLALAPAPAAAGPVDDASALVDLWSTTYSANDRNRLAALYATDAILLGTTDPVVTKGRDAIREYFAVLDAGGRRNVIVEKNAIVLGDDAVVVTGFYNFSRKEQGFEPRPSRFTFVVAKRNGKWMIVHHHSSPRAAQRQ